jgi:2Fe-2S ferredoxin
MGLRRYNLLFPELGRSIQVDPENLPVEDGLPGSILSLALAAGIPLEHACGGVCACSTCHVHVVTGLNSCSAPSEEEEDQLDLAPDLLPESRLACRCIPNGSQDVEVRIPQWNRNRASSGHS